jgi:hypothetical protein
MFRRLVADVTVPYGASLRLKDQDLLTSSLPSTLDKAFDTSFDFSDFALHMRARGETHPSDATKSILWRKSTYVGALSTATVRYKVPPESSTEATIVVEEPDSTVSIYLPSGAARDITPVPGQVVYFASAQNAVVSAYTISSITRTGGNTVTATLTAPFSMTPGAGMTTSTTVWVSVTSSNFASGNKTITGTGSSTITWTETGSNVTEAPAGAYAAFAVNPAVFSVVQAGDYSNGWNNYFGSSGTHLMSVSATSQYGVQFAVTSGFVSGRRTIGAFNDFFFYPISQSTSGTASDLTATALAALVNATTDTPIVGAVTGTGAGIITQSYTDDAAATALLQDGILHILSSAWNNSVGNYDLTLKFTPLVASLDYANETFRLVPTTSKNVAEFLARPAVTGLTFSGGDLEQDNQAEHVQVATTTLGTEGAVEVTGGNANDLRLSVVGTASVVSGTLKIPVRTSTDLATVPTMSWALIHTGQVVPKKMSWTASSSLTFTAATKRVRLTGGGTAWATSGPDLITSGHWYVEQHGRFTAYTVQGTAGQLAGLSVGDWAVLAGGSASLANLGTFRIVNVVGNTFWVENGSAVPEDTIIGTARFYTYDSIMPGDTFQVGTAAFGSGNQGLWTVSRNDDGDGNDTGTFYVTGTIVNNGPTVIGTNTSYVRVVPATAPTSFGRIRNYMTDPDDSTVTNLYLDTIDTTRPELVSLPAEAVVQVLDRLEFPTNIATGQDGYVHDIGLVAAVNQVLYGDESDPDTYPGIVSVGDHVYCGPPLVRRVQISVAIREAPGSDATSDVQAAIAAVINSAGGKPVAISAYLAAAQKVTGVISVVPIDPVPATSADTIPVQPGEKATILDVDNDVQVSIIGE